MPLRNLWNRVGLFLKFGFCFFTENFFWQKFLQNQQTIMVIKRDRMTISGELCSLPSRTFILSINRTEFANWKGGNRRGCSQENTVCLKSGGRGMGKRGRGRGRGSSLSEIRHLGLLVVADNLFAQIRYKTKHCWHARGVSLTTSFL